MMLTTITLLCAVSIVATQTCLDNDTKAAIDSIRSSLTTLETTLTTKKSTRCKSGWKGFKDHCYLFSAETKPWVEAEMSCRELGAYLVQITDPAENAWIVDNIKASGQESPWMGATDFQEGDWRWVNDLSKVVYADWSPGQPDNTNGNEDCGHFYKVFKYKWNDWPCQDPFHYVCESHMENSCQPYSKIFRP